MAELRHEINMQPVLNSSVVANPVHFLWHRCKPLSAVLITFSADLMSMEESQI